MLEALEEHTVYNNLAYAFVLERWDDFVKTSEVRGEPLSVEEQAEIKATFQKLQLNAHRLAVAFTFKRIGEL